MSKTFRTLAALKRRAHHIKTETGVTHAEALRLAAWEGGFQTYAHAQRTLRTGSEVPGSPSPERRGDRRRLSPFQAEARSRWETAIADPALGRMAETRIWEDPSDILRILDRVLSQTHNHALLPRSGGLDLHGARRSSEDGCIELKISEGRGHVVRPGSLRLETFIDAPAESFFLLEAKPLEPTDVDDDPEASEADRREIRAWRLERAREEVLELEPGDYVPRSVWDQGRLGFDANGEEIPLPSSARVIVRWLGGKIMIVSTGSLWNGTPGTYDARHERMSAERIRSAIQRALDALEDAA